MSRRGDRVPWPLDLPPGMAPSCFACPTCGFRTRRWAVPGDSYPAPQCGRDKPPGTHPLVDMAPCAPFDLDWGDGEDVPDGA